MDRDGMNEAVKQSISGYRRGKKSHKNALEPELNREQLLKDQENFFDRNRWNVPVKNSDLKSQYLKIINRAEINPLEEVEV